MVNSSVFIEVLVYIVVQKTDTLYFIRAVQELPMCENELEKLGVTVWVKHAREELARNGFSAARIIEVNKNSYIVADGKYELLAELSGKFLFDAEESADYPTVGDWVTIQSLDRNTHAIVHNVLPRTTVLKRKESGKRIAFQLIAANIDFGLILQSADSPNFNLLDRYLVMLHECGIKPLLILSKIDLLSSAEVSSLNDRLTKLQTEHLLLSNITESGIAEVTKKLIPGKTYCLLGQSGVGKTSLLNRLLRTDNLKVNEVREKDGKGRHTTVRRQLIRLDSGSIVIDTPGIRELGNFDTEHGLQQTFEDFLSLTEQCRFKDCTHLFEEGCALIAAVTSGEIEESKYESFMKLRKESEFYEMSYREKRHKDRSFGKMIKNYKKTMRKV